MSSISISVVTYFNPVAELARLVESIRKCTLPYSLSIVDNAADFHIQSFCEKESIDYTPIPENIGFGAAHNKILKSRIDNFRYHLVINPDVYFDSGTLEKLFSFMEGNPDVGLCTPKVLYPSGELQYLCKLIPSPADLITRRFLPEFMQIGTGAYKYEMRNFNYSENMEAPVLSGCCMFLRAEALKVCGFFDERFFLYLEDVDLSRRIYSKYRNMHFAGSSIYHHYQKSSYSSTMARKLHIQSAIKYFNKWGWLFDRERRQLNNRAVKANHVQ